MNIDNLDNSIDNIIDNNILPRIENKIIPSIPDCENALSLVRMYGWDYGIGLEAGIRILSPVGGAYYYGDEIVSKFEGTGVWGFINNAGYGLLASSLNVTDYPWQAIWTEPFTATKICP